MARLSHANLVFVLLLLFCFVSSNSHPLKACNVDRIYQLGDSISDTGNLIREVPVGATTPYARFPYGQRIGKATGRCSDGFLIIDYIASFLGYDYALPPYKNLNSDFRTGVNFAVAGATALPSKMLAANYNISSPLTNSSLNVQLDWMSTHFNSICLHQRDCFEKLENALFMVGEIGASDYSYAILQGKTMEEVKLMVPQVVDAIIEAVKKVISFGAIKVVVPGQFPMGCLPIYKTVFESNSTGAYDENNCLEELNEFSRYHNEQLQEAIEKLKQEEKPNALIAYGDSYKAYQYQLSITTKDYGYEVEEVCCGIGGKYNFNTTRMCGTGSDSKVGACPHPEIYINWDGMHLTQEANELIAETLMYDAFYHLQCHFRQ